MAGKIESARVRIESIAQETQSGEPWIESKTGGIEEAPVGIEKEPDEIESATGRI